MEKVTKKILNIYPKNLIRLSPNEDISDYSATNAGSAATHFSNDKRLDFQGTNDDRLAGIEAGDGDDDNEDSRHSATG
jgi:hypothetical protein